MESYGIHGKNGWMRHGEKRNTAKPRNLDKVRSIIAALQEHLSRHPRDKFSQMHLDKLMKLV